MNETHLLTDAQIARRKTAAIWLIGVGLLLKCVEGSLPVPIGDLLGFLIRFGIYLFPMVLILGGLSLLYPANRVAVLTIRIWKIGWIVLCVNGLAMYLPVGDLFYCACVLLLYGTVIPMQNGYGYAWGRHLRAGIIIMILLALTDRFNFGKEQQIIELAQKDWQFIMLINKVKWALFTLCWILIFIGYKNTIRSSLFASTSAQLEGFAGTPAPRASFFNAPVCGAIAGSVFCIGLTAVLMFFWNDIYNAF